jgi:hypothetical protein
MTERARLRWHEWIPGWIPICVTLIVGFGTLSAKIQNFEDRLGVLEKSQTETNKVVQWMRDYVIQHGGKVSNSAPPISRNDPPETQDASGGRTSW